MAISTTKRRKIERLIRLTYDSLQSHLEWCYKDSVEGKGFHVKAVRDYAEMIKLLSELL